MDRALLGGVLAGLVVYLGSESTSSAKMASVLVAAATVVVLWQVFPKDGNPKPKLTTPPNPERPVPPPSEEPVVPSLPEKVPPVPVPATPANVPPPEPDISKSEPSPAPTEPKLRAWKQRSVAAATV